MEQKPDRTITCFDKPSDALHLDLITAVLQ